MFGASTFGSTAYGAAYAQAAPTAPTPDTTSPVMVGSLVVSAITQTTAHAAWQAATDNVGVVGYEFSCDTGTPTWLNIGTALSADPVGLTASTNYTARARSVDAAGNRSTPITYQFSTLAVPPVDNGGGTPATGTIDVLKVPASRTVVFGGSIRVVSFPGNIRTVEF